MAGTATINTEISFSGLGTMSAISTSFTLSYDEATSQVIDLAAGGAAEATIDVTALTTVHGVFINILAGEATLTAGVGIDLLNASYGVKHAELIVGQAQFFIPSGTTMSVLNLSASDIATVEYIVFGT